MRKLNIAFSILGLCLTILPSLFVFYGLMTWKIHTQLMFAGMLFWFTFAPLWMRKRKI